MDNQLSKTAHYFNELLGSSMKVTNPIHPLYGQSVVVRQIRKVGKQTKIIVESPLGGVLSIPESETDLGVQYSSSTQQDKTPLFLPEKLLRLSEWVAASSKSLTEKSTLVFLLTFLGTEWV